MTGQVLHAQNKHFEPINTLCLDSKLLDSLCLAPRYNHIGIELTTLVANSDHFLSGNFTISADMCVCTCSHLGAHTASALLGCTEVTAILFSVQSHSGVLCHKNQSFFLISYTISEHRDILLNCKPGRKTFVLNGNLNVVRESLSSFLTCELSSTPQLQMKGRC